MHDDDRAPDQPASRTPDGPPSRTSARPADRSNEREHGHDDSHARERGRTDGQEHRHEVGHEHGHAHGHGHGHGHDHQHVPPDIALRVRALESVLTEKGMVDPAALDEIVDRYEHRVGPRNGAEVVARAWVDADYRARLLADGTAAIGELGYLGDQGEHMKVVANTPQVHNLIVCTLCSCYPWPTLGLPPVWYKSSAYRARAVLEPRQVLREFGLDLPDEVEVRVWDSTAEIRYLVLPERPAGTEGMTEEELARIVTRDAMIGVARVDAPDRREGP